MTMTKLVLDNKIQLKNQHTTEIINMRKIEKTQTITLLVLAGLIVLVGGSFFQDARSIESHEDRTPSKSKYIIENLKGDSLGTHFYWNVLAGEPLYVNIKNSANLSPEKLEIVKDAILSTEFYEINDNKLGKAPKGTMSKFYLGWKGALSEIEQDTENAIPKNFEIRSTGNSAGDIIITLTDMKDVDGSAGVTKSTAYGNQILKSEITIYDVSSLSDRELEQVSRHEFGHAMGLAHSSAPEDLMYPEIKSAYPYISECDISGIVSLYDGKTSDKVICKK